MGNCPGLCPGLRVWLPAWGRRVSEQETAQRQKIQAGLLTQRLEQHKESVGSEARSAKKQSWMMRMEN